ncbi:MAG: transcription termination/antitermination protein NusG [Bacillota bacterium]|nr:transcription termination/antitermination protein NusG [Bacillota bacterium]
MGVTHTYPDYENKVKANLERRVKTMEKEDKIFRVLVPTEHE